MLRRLNAFVFAALTALACQAFAAVDVNKANQAELETVKGIGPALSTKILDARKSAAFKDWGDFVDRVSGVGPGNAARFSQAGLTVGDQPYAGGAAAPKATAAGTTNTPTDKPARKPRADKPAQ